MALRVRRTLPLAAILVASTLLSACATTYDSAGNTYYSLWPFVNARTDLQLNYPAPDPKKLRLSRDPDPLDWISPYPPIDPRVTSPYSQNDTELPVRLAAQSDNAPCANRCDTQEPRALVALRADAGNGRRTASR